MVLYFPLQRPSTQPEAQVKSPYFPSLKTLFLSSFFLTITQAIAVIPVQAAERITFHYGEFEFVMSLAELEAAIVPSSQPSTFSRAKLNSPLPALSPEVSAQLGSILNLALPPLPPQALENLLQEPSVTALLQAAGTLIQDQHQNNGAEALKQAIAQAAASPEGLTGLNVLRHFPGEIQWDAQGSLALWQQHRQLRQQTAALMQALEPTAAPARLSARPQTSLPARDLAFASAKFNAFTAPGKPTQNWPPPNGLSPNRTRLPGQTFEQDLRRPGTVAYTEQDLLLWDGARDRQFTARLYLPEPGLAAASLAPTKEPSQDPSQDPASAIASQASAGIATPLVLMSHGLASSLESRAFFAQHLASQGIAVAMVQHPGSDIVQLQALLEGQAETAAPPAAFIDRPLDLRFLLDELTRRSSATWREPPQPPLEPPHLPLSP
ncbi:MAG: alpha/beta hydrolase, partial [Synechococcales cyanobacterium RM1_1_8]|nr:alpha/beta hydrolase [Synechococcales cyanobacterium RM1_1_8]